MVIEKEVELDRFSRIILEFIHHKVTTRADICAFLGVTKDSFVTVQFHFLLKNDLIREVEVDEYEITHEGLAFLENRTKVKELETVAFEYFMVERIHYFKNDLTQDFFDPRRLIDKGQSPVKRKAFSGYRVMQTHQLQPLELETSRFIKHQEKHRPTVAQISKQRNDFAQFFHQQHPTAHFYDFADNEIETHKRTICFLGLLYQHKDNPTDQRIEVRQSEKSIEPCADKRNELEELLSKKVQHYLDAHPGWIK